MWIRTKLEEYGNSTVYLFMHHTPFKIGIHTLDTRKLRDRSERIQ
jgi:hypothetical protein